MADKASEAANRASDTAGRATETAWEYSSGKESERREVREH